MIPTVEHLVVRARDGDREAFQELIRPRRRMIQGMIRLLGKGRLDADDVMQDVLLEVWRSLPRLREPLRFLPWLQGVVRFTCRRELRRVRHEPDRDSVEVDALPASPMITSRIDELFGSLPEEMSLVMREKFCEDRSYREIAERTGLSVARVRAHVEKGLRSLSTKMRDERGGSSR